MPTFWLFFSYLLGAVPFGYLIAKIYGKEILKIGWRKTSGSNVLKNVSKTAGVLTGILDLSKGYLAVYGAQKMGFSQEVQIFSGVLAISGHNWSIFLKFAGGRGIGTFIGGLLAFSPKIFVLSAIPIVSLALIWNASIGTLLFLATAIFTSVYFAQFEIAGFYALFSLLPILVKRLSPIKEISEAQNPAILLRNRLLFDNDEARFDLRIKRIFQKIKGNPRRPSKNIINHLTNSILLPPKIGWRTVKFGVKVAKKPIDPAKEILARQIKKLLFSYPEKVVTEIGLADLKRMMMAASKKIVFCQEEINRINVFPVADKDTGYNLAATLLGIEGVINQKKYKTIFELAQDIKEAALINARGNAGMIFTGYLIRVLDQIKHFESVDSLNFSLAMRKGIKSARRSIFEPVEGTILDVISVSGQKAYEMAKIKKEKNIIGVLEEVLRHSQIALKETKEKLEVLKENDVVDAGALGFVKILEAWLESLKGMTPALELEAKPPTSPFYEKGGIEEKLAYQYDLVFRTEKPAVPELENLEKEISLLGGSIDVIKSEKDIKFHLHTNFPERVKEKIGNFKIKEWQIEELPSRTAKITTKKPLGLVVGETAGLPQHFLDENQIEVVPFKVNFPDGRKIPGRDFYEEIKRVKKLPTVSVPTFAEYLAFYKKALERFEKILVVTLPSRLSGAYSQARIARSVFKKPEKLKINIFDCFTAEVAEGLIIWQIQKWLKEGKELEEVLVLLKDFCPEVKLFGCLKDLKYGAQGGRMKIPKILIPLFTLFQKVGVRILLGLKDGKVKLLGLRLGRNVAKILAEEVEKERKGRPVRAAIGQADNLKEAQELKKFLEEKSEIEVLFISPISPVIGIHAGPGTLIVAFHPVDPAPISP